LSKLFRISFLVSPEDSFIQLSGSFAATVFWVSVGACLVAQVALIVAAIRVPGEPTPEHPMRSPSRIVELGWVTLPAVMLALVLLFTWRAMQRQAAEPMPASSSASAAS
jgi:heme/copper-type cytochrome/quinol oxidase subunit 2